jgi:AcrR family transcriptional regulator
LDQSCRLLARPAKVAGGRGKDTRERIFLTAVRLFSERGFRGVSVRDITREVGIKESSLYNHFPSKDAIIESIYDSFRERLISHEVTVEAVEQRLNEIPAGEYFRSAFAGYVDALTNPFSVMVWRILVSEQFHDPRANTLYNVDIGNKLHHDTILVLDRMRKRGLIRDVDLEAAALAQVEAIKGMLFKYIGIGDAGKQEFLDRAHRHIEFFWECIRA